MKLLSKNSFFLKLFYILMLSIIVDGCKKADRFSASMGSESKLSAGLGLAKQNEESAQIVYQWYKFMTTLQRPLAPQPLVFTQTRAFGYIGIGLFESVQPGITGGSSFGPKLYEMPAMPKPNHSKDYLWNASANAALASMFKQFLANLSITDKAAIDAHELEVRNQLKLTSSEDIMQRSEAFGRSIGTAIYNWSKTDNFSITSGTYSSLIQPWAWQSTAPNFPLAFGDNLQYSRPFLKYTLNSTVPEIPVAYSEDHSSAFYKAAFEVYKLGGKLTATTPNKATANWWADAGGTGTGLPAPYHLLAVVTSVLESQHSGLWKAAEVYAKTGIALKDGAINTFRAKYHYNLLRPVTYIRRHIDPTWLSHLTTPPYPEYPSGLVGFYGALTQVLINEFGDIPITDNAYAWKSLPARHFSSISEMRAEAATSRVYAGIHYRFTQNTSIDIGIKLGNEISRITVVGPSYP